MISDGHPSGCIVGLDPTRHVDEPVDASVRAARPATLDGAVVALISNGKERAADFLMRLYVELAELAKLRDYVLIQKTEFYAPPTEDDWRLVRARATVGVAAFGG
jgi:hypothetical protein